MHVLGSTHTGNSAIQEENATHLSKVMQGEAIKIMHYYIYIYINVYLHTEPNAHYYINVYLRREPNANIRTTKKD